MMQRLIFATLLFVHVVACAQTNTSAITLAEVTRIETALASDSMQGREAGTAGSEMAARFIAEEFKKAGLQPLAGNTYLQSFNMLRPKLRSITGTADGVAIKASSLMVLSYQPKLQVGETSGYKVVHVGKDESLFRSINQLVRQNQNTIVFVDTSFAKQFPRLAGFQQMIFERDTIVANKSNTLIVLGHFNPKQFQFTIEQDVEKVALSNVVGVLPGKAKKGEQVIFSAHYDHLGIGQPQQGDSIYNGANDDAAGTTAVILLARHFKQKADNARTLLFVAFTAEEIGGFGSQYFSQQVVPDSVVAMLNIEMIGTESKWGRNSAYITGYDKTDMGPMLQKTLAGSPFVFHPDPYPEQQLFYRSDNATLARLGVPAHTLSTSKMDSEPNYHQASDEVETLDLPNMTEIIKAVAESSKNIIAGKATPSRVKAESLR